MKEMLCRENRNWAAWFRTACRSAVISLVSVRHRSSWQGRGEGSAREAEMKLPRMESGGAQLKGNLKSRKNFF